MIDLQANASKCAAACAFRQDYLADRSHRTMLLMMRALWRVFATNLESLPNAQILAEFESLSELHARVLAMTAPTLH
jgi:hypothetical protein